MKLTVVSRVAFAGLLSFAFLPGCQATKDFAAAHGLSTPSSDAVSLIQSYLGNIGDLTSLLNGATTTTAAQTAAPQAASKLDTIKSLASKISGLSTTDKASLASSYGSKLSDAISKLKSAATSASTNPQAAPSLSSILQNIDYKQLLPF